MVAPTTVAAGQEDDIPAVIEEEVAVAKEAAPPAVSSEMSGESAAQKADIPDSTVKVEAVSEVQRKIAGDGIVYAKLTFRCA